MLQVVQHTSFYTVAAVTIPATGPGQRHYDDDATCGKSMP